MYSALKNCLKDYSKSKLREKTGNISHNQKMLMSLYSSWFSVVAHEIFVQVCEIDCKIEFAYDVWTHWLEPLKSRQQWQQHLFRADEFKLSVIYKQCWKLKRIVC